MKMWWPFTRKPSETSLLCLTITKLAAEIQLQSESNRKMSEKLLAAVTEKDAQIKLVLESKFQQYVVQSPARETPKQEPESIEHLSDVSEMSEASAEAEVIKNTKASNQADTELEALLLEEFEEIAQEHAEAHGQQAQA